ncbi:MAG: LAGLIDADG family homing endonuclease [Candidatus Baldrarchaeia archaeon]
MYEEIEHIFRAYDIRGIYNQDLTPEIVARIGTAFGTLLDGEGTISMGKDVRTSSTAIENALTAGVTSTGINVELLGTLPIQVTNWATWQGNYKAGIVITASVDGSEYTLIKDLEKNQIFLVKVGEFINKVIKEKLSLKRFAVLSFDPKNGKTTFKPIKNVFVHKLNEPLYELKLKNGKIIKVTASHSVYTYRNNKLVCIPTSKLKVGDLIATTRIIPNVINTPKINLVKELWPYRSELRTIILIGPDILKIRRKRLVSERKKRIMLSGEGRQLLIKVRRKIGLSRKRAAKKLGISHTTIQRIELGKSRKYVKEEYIRKYVGSLGFDADKFLQSYSLKTKRFHARWIDGRTQNRIKLTDLTEEEVKEIENCVLHGRGYPKNSIPNILEITPEFARLIGYYIAEGSLECEDRVCFNLGSPSDGHEKFIINDIKYCSKKCFEIEPKIYKEKGNRTKVAIDNVVIYGIFAKILKFENKRSDTKKLPEFVYTLPPELKINLLKGIFLGDGTLSNGIKFSTTSKELAIGISYLLTQLGIVYSFSKEKDKRKNRKTLYNIFVTSKQELKKIKDIWKDHWKSKTLSLTYKGNKKEHLKFGDLILLPIKEIKKVKPSSKYVYDFSVEGETFIAGIGGICCHNSHNPPEYNGVRFRHCDGTGYIDIENEKMKEIFYKGNFKLAKWNKIGKIRQLDTKEIIHKYIDFALKHVKPERKVKIVLDLGNGAASYVAPKLFKEAGCEVITINEKPDGTFPGRTPDPLEDPLEELKKTVVQEKAELGVAFDGDGDRAIMVDDLGRKVQTEKAGIIIAKYLLQRKRGKIVANISCSMIIEEELSKVGGEVVRCRVGDVFVSRTAKENKATFGVEISAHYFLPIFGFYFDDAILASLLMTEILSKTEKRLSQLLDEIPTYPLKRTNISCPDKIKFKITEQLKEEHMEKGYKVDTTDGVKILLEDAWILIRPSNTEPKIRMTIEAHTTKKLNELFKHYTEKINNLIQQLG